MQSLKHMIRMEVEKKVVSLLEQEPELKHVGERIKNEMKQQKAACSDHCDDTYLQLDPAATSRTPSASCPGYSQEPQ